jgi:hypothetical protein
MSALAALAVIFIAPLLASVIVGTILPQPISLGGMIVTYFLASIVSVFVASEAHAGKIRSLADLRSVIAFGFKAFGWWAVAMSAIGVAVLGLYAVN